MPEELRVHDLDELLQRRQLLLHAALVAQEILLLRGGGGEPKSVATDRGREATGGRRRGLTIRFMTATKHQNVLGSSEPMAT